tara:strand:- start:51 stop:506 length:456 start_codon:yes stop_codon:yes gene_type:complete
MSDYRETEELFYPKKPKSDNDFFSPGNLKKYSNFADEVLGPFTGQRKAGDGMSEYYKELARRPFGGGKSSGRSETLADGSLTALYPDSFEPIIFPGGGGGGVGGSSTTQRLAGAATGALSGAATGASMGKVLGLPGAAVGAVIGGLGGLFG